MLLSHRPIAFGSRFAFAVICLLVFSGGDIFASDPATPSVHPVQAELLGPLDVTRVKEGAPVLARVFEDWKDEGCHLRPGAMIEGHVVQVTRRSKTEKTSVMQLAFGKADCNNHPPRTTNSR